MNDRIVVIDANNQLHRVYHPMGAMGAARWWLPFLNAVCNELAGGERLNVYVAFDGSSGTTWRKELEPTYKSDRSTKDGDLCQLLAQASFAAGDEGYQVFNVEDAEADDVVAALVSRTKSKAIMVSSDKDLFQLLEAGRVNQLRKFSINRNTVQCFHKSRLLLELGCTTNHPRKEPRHGRARMLRLLIRSQ